MHHADADGRADRAAVDLARRLGKIGADRVRRSASARSRLDVVQHGRELLAAEAAEQVDAPQSALAVLGENLQHAVADRMAEAVVDRLEMIEVDQQHGGRTRIGRAGA